jgi:superfamily II DNA helicase RecQ
LVFAAVETATTQCFQTWLTSLGTRLKRIVFQEVHLAITATYRPQMKSLARLRAVAVPFVIITATAPPILRETLLDHFETRLVQDRGESEGDCG